LANDRIPIKTRWTIDLDPNLTIHPLSGDVSRKVDADAVKESVLNLIFNEPYDVPFHPDINGGIWGLLGMPCDSMTAGLIMDQIRRVISKYEPRCRIIDLSVVAQIDISAFQVRIVFTVNTVNEVQELSFPLTRRR
jgi:phage baseplate assembly protein W